MSELLIVGQISRNSLVRTQHASLALKMTANIERLHLLANDAELAKSAADMMPLLVAVAGADR